MKHYSQLIALLVALLPACATLSAQELHTSPFHDDDHEHGLFVGGAATYWNNNKTNTSTLQLFPEAGWRFNRTWAAGVMLGYGLSNEKNDGNTKHTHVFKFSPFARYYYMHQGPFNLYIDGGVGYNHISPAGNETLNRKNGFEVGLRPGVCVDLTKGFCLCLRMGFAGYRNNYFVGEEHEIGNDGWGLRFAPEEVMIGLELEF